jgi:hypothetical protein
MADPHSLAFLRIPDDVLTALSFRPLHFALQPYHHLLRLLHLLAVAVFFGALALLDLRLAGLRRAIPLRALAVDALPAIRGGFAIALASGAMLFLYDPIHVGRHAYFVPKLLLMTAGMVNAALFHRTAYPAALAAGARMPWQARLAGLASLAIWTGTIACAALNTEAAPKLLLR